MSFHSHLVTLLDRQQLSLSASSNLSASREHTSARSIDPASGITSELRTVGAQRRLHVLRADGRSPTWLILPALGLPAAAYAPMLRALQGDRAACAVDLAGFGASSAETSMPSYAHHLCMVLHLLASITGPIVIVGHSVGAALASEIARRRPDRVRALVLCGYGRLESGAHWRRQLRLCAAHPERALDEHAGHSAAFVARIQSALLEARSRPAYDSFFDEHGITALRSGLRGVHVPTLLLHGEHDGIVGRDLLQAAANDTPDARIRLLARCGHLASIERPDAFAEAAREFVSARHSH